MAEDAFVEITDPQTGKTFFANILTGECTWDKPQNAKVKPKDPNGEWWELFDENHKLPYFYNTKTGETEWLRPQNATVVPLMAIQNSSIGKRVSVALQRASMMGTTTDMPDFSSMGNSQNGGSRLARVESSAKPAVNGNAGASNQNMYGSSAPMNSSMSGAAAAPMGSSMPEYSSSALENASPRGPQVASSYSQGSPLARSNTNPYGNNQSGSNGPPYAGNNGQQQMNSNSQYMQQQPQQQQQQLYGGSPYRNPTQQQHPSQQQQPAFGGYQQQQQSQQQQSQQQHGGPQGQQPNKNGGYQFGSSPPGGASPTSGQNGAGESVWQQAKKFGIGQPVNNPEAAMSMNPFNRKGSIAPQQFERPPTLPKDLQLHITQFRIDGFAQRYFAEHRRGIFRRRVPVEKMLEWQKDTLKSPLMVMNKEYHKEAQKCFKLLQRIMGDRGGVPANSEQHRKEIQELLDKGINSGILRDEIYVQLCKQLSHNPQPESIFRGWQFMCVITIAFPPSKNFEEYLKSFVQQHFGVRENRVDILSKHAHKKLLRICKVGPRGKTISLQEIERAQEAPFLASVFGETLDDIMKTQTAEFPELKLPRILPFLAEAILTLNGCKTEGVFRVPGDVDAVTDLKCRIEKNEYSMAGIVDPNVPGSLLKSWLRDLADPLIPPEHYQPCIDVGANEMAPEAPRNAARIVEQLPEVNRRVVQYMIRFLRIVGDPQNQPFTKMSVGNLAMVFAPNFLRCPSDSPATIFENTKYEQAWLRILITSNVLG